MGKRRAVEGWPARVSRTGPRGHYREREPFMRTAPLTQAAMVTASVTALGRYMVEVACEDTPRALRVARQVCAYPDVWTCLAIYLGALATAELYRPGARSQPLMVHSDGTVAPPQPEDAGPYAYITMLTHMADGDTVKAIDVAERFYGEHPTLRYTFLVHLIQAAHIVLHTPGR